MQAVVEGDGFQCIARVRGGLGGCNLFRVREVGALTLTGWQRGELCALLLVADVIGRVWQTNQDVSPSSGADEQISVSLWKKSDGASGS